MYKGNTKERGFAQSNNSEINGNLLGVLKRMNARLARLESRLVQLMLHTGLDPYTKTYDDEYTYHEKG